MKQRHVLKPLLVACLVAAAIATAGCGTNGFPGIVVPTDLGAGAQVASLTIAPDTVNVLAAGDVVQLTATALDADGAPLADAVIAWSSSDLSVATVSDSGVVTGVGQGSATITASSGGVAATALVTVGLTQSLTANP